MKRLAGILVGALCLFSCAAPIHAENVNVLVIDSGSDFSHSALKDLAQPNEKELKGQTGKDDDNNGYTDDIYGWNFIDKTNQLVNLENTPPNYDEVLEIMRLIGIIQNYGKEALTADEYAHLIKRYKDKKFWAWIGFVGGWAHGTHCAGIIATDNEAVDFKAVKHIPTGNPPEKTIKKAIAKIISNMLHNKKKIKKGPKISLEQLGQMFAQLAPDYIASVKKEAEYIASLKPRLINCSFGIPNENIKASIKQNMVYQWGWTNPTDEEVQKVVNLFVEKAFLPKDKAFFSGCKDALIFIAAGNSSEDLDGIVSSPNDVPIENKIVIAATDANKKLAGFSCHGTTVVDVAVPGVNIYATYPNQKMGYMSGTSMACPMALKFASYVLQKNPDLTPVQLKKILMGTVDKKEWLKDKVKSGGIINQNRAVFAAIMVKSGKDVATAIRIANEKVDDIEYRPAKFKGPDLSDEMIRNIYFSAVF